MKNKTDLSIWLTECLKSVEGYKIESWRIIDKYFTDWLDDNNMILINELNLEHFAKSLSDNDNIEPRIDYEDLD